MARDTTTRFTLTGTLTCRTSLHVGGFGDDPDTDLPLARDGRGRCYVPGTSLSGALRQWCDRAFDAADTERIWGTQTKNPKTGEEHGYASFVTVDDLYVADEQLIPQVRDGVGIDRRTGTAAEHIKYDRAVLPRGTVLTGFALTADVRTEDTELTLAMLVGLRNALAAGRIRFGAAKTRGLGKVELLNPRLGRTETLTRTGVFQLLNGTDTEVPEARLAGLAAPKESPRLDIRIDWKPDGPLMVKAGFDGIAVDVLPLVSATGPNAVAPVLPGSSIKGALRNRAEQIVCTLLDIGGDATIDPKQRFLSDLIVPLVDELFGSRGGLLVSPSPGPKRRGHFRHPTTDEKKLGLGALSVDDCYARVAIDARKWSVVASADERQLTSNKLSAEQALRTALEDAGLRSWQQAFHVAIDRWTGGAAESFLYTVLEPHATEWEPIEMTVDLERTPPAGVTLLLLVLRDLAVGRLPLGFAVNRGMGAVKGVTVEVTPHAAPEFGTASFTFATLLPSVREHLNRAWQVWLDQAPVAETAT